MAAVRNLLLTATVLGASALALPTLSAASLSTFRSSVTEHISWIGLVNSAASGTSLEKTAGCDGCQDSRARSLQQISSGDGYVEFRVSSSGLIVGLTNPSSANIDFALSVKAGSYPSVYEDGLWSGDSFPARSRENDSYRIAVVGGRVQYSLNGSVFYTSGRIPTYPLVVAADLTGLSSAVRNAVINHITSTPVLDDPTPPIDYSVSANRIPVPLASGTPDPTLLPVATVSQTPQTGAYNALNVP